MSVVSSYVYNQMYNNQNGDGNNDFLTRGGLPGLELFNSEIGGGQGDSLNGKVVPIGLSVILRQPRLNTEYHVDAGGAAVVSDDMFDRLFDAISPSTKRRRTTPTKRTRESGSRKISKKST